MRVLIQLVRPESLLLVLWATQLARMAWPSPAMNLVGAAAAAVYILRVFVLLRRPSIVLCSGLATVAVVLILLYGGPANVLVGFEAAPMFAGWFATIVLLRATAEQLRHITAARELFERLKPDHRLGGFLVGCHLLAAVLGPGAYAITAPLVGKGEGGREQDHLAAMRACHRGASVAGLWSPFWIAMALASQYVPGVPLWQVMALGGSMAACTLTASHVMFSREPGLTLLWRALRSLQPIVPPVALCVLLVAVLSGATVLSTMEALIVSVPVLCLATLVAKGRRALATTLVQTYRGTAYIGNEIAILTISLALGGVVRHVFAATGITHWIGSLDLPAVAVIAIIIGVTSASALVGVHQIVSVSLLLTVFSDLPVQVAGLVLIESTLVAWSCSSMIGLSAILVATATTMFHTTPEKVILGPNLKFATLFAIGSILVLAAVNALVG